MRAPRTDTAAASSGPPTVLEAEARWEASLEVDPEMRSDLEQRLVDLLGGASDIAGLSHDMLYAVLQNRMRDLDGQISTIMNGLTDRTRQAEAIGESLSEMRNVQTFLQPHTNADGNVRMDDPIDRNGFYSLCRAAGLNDAEASAAWRSLTADSAGATVRLDAALNTVLPTPAGTDPMSARLATRQGMDNEIDNLNQDLQDCNRGNELLMIKLQTLMDQRKQSISMCSDMSSSLSEMQMTPIRNLKG